MAHTLLLLVQPERLRANALNTVKKVRNKNGKIKAIFAQYVKRFSALIFYNLYVFHLITGMVGSCVNI